MIKILAIGNSYSQDATSLLELINPELLVRNLYVSGCSLEMHMDYLKNEKAIYEYQQNASKQIPELISLQTALKKEKWDYITIQQVSTLSGIYSSYEPYLSQLIEYLKNNTSAKIIFHETWSYETGCPHTGFEKYQNTDEIMFNHIVKVKQEIEKKYNLPVICTGEFIENLRKTPFFDYTQKGLSLCRDSYQHLSYGYGRISASVFWNLFFTDTIPAFIFTNESEGIKTILKEALDWKKKHRN